VLCKLPSSGPRLLEANARAGRLAHIYKNHAMIGEG